MIKDPSAVLDYGLRWKPWLTEFESVVTSAWSITPNTSLTIDDATHDATSTTVWLSGGIAGQAYRLTNSISTNAGRTDERTIIIAVRER